MTIITKPYITKMVEVDTMPRGYDVEVDVCKCELIELTTETQEHIIQNMDGDLSRYLKNVIKDKYDGERVVYSYQDPEA